MTDPRNKPRTAELRDSERPASSAFAVRTLELRHDEDHRPPTQLTDYQAILSLCAARMVATTDRRGGSSLLADRKQLDKEIAHLSRAMAELALAAEGK